MLKKIFAFLLCLILISCMAFPDPAAALSYSDTQEYVDLLSASSYYISGWSDSDEDTELVEFYDLVSDRPYFDTITGYIGSGEFTSYSYKQVSHIRISWAPLNFVSTSSLYIYTYLASSSNIKFTVNGKSVTATYIGTTNGVVCYRLDFTQSYVKTVTVTFNRNSNFVNMPFIAASLTSSSVSVVFQSGFMQADFYFEDYNDSLEEWVIIAERMLDVPIELQSDKDYSYYSPKLDYQSYWVDQFYRLRQVRMHLTFDVGSLSVSDVTDYVTMTFSSIGDTELASAYVSSSFFDDSQDAVSIDSELYFGDFGNVGFNGHYKDYESNGYTLFCDLNGVDLSQRSILHVELVVSPINTKYDGDDYDRYVYFELFESYYSYFLYSNFTESSVLSYLENLLKVDSLSMSLLDQFYDSYSDNSHDIISYLELIYESLNASNSQKDEIAQGQEQMQSQGSTINDLNQTMQQVDKPSLDQFSDIGSAVTSGLVSNNFLATVVNEPHVYSILVLVGVLMLISYIFFGKKG